MRAFFLAALTIDGRNRYAEAKTYGASSVMPPSALDLVRQFVADRLDARRFERQLYENPELESLLKTGVVDWDDERVAPNVYDYLLWLDYGDPRDVFKAQIALEVFLNRRQPPRPSGLRIVNANRCGVLSPQALDAFERNHGIRLPSDYREYLLAYNGGVPEDRSFWIVKDSDGRDIDQLYGLGGKDTSLEASVNSSLFGVPSHLLPIGDNGMGDYICLAVRNPDRGAVFFVDHELHPYDTPDSLDGITKLAPSFHAFLQLLTP